ncbi:hypothetical protein KAR91_27770 [Candidatus Pacearchaeota archaeon]|nr:hypothetical protein [Candidatus Pacearchaeota archaeon]
MRIIHKDNFEEFALKNQNKFRATSFADPYSQGEGLNDTLFDQSFSLKSKNYDSPYEKICKSGAFKGQPIMNMAKSFDLAQHNPADLYDFVNATIIDVSRKVAVQPLLHSFVYKTDVDQGASKVTTLRDTLEPGMHFKQIEGSGDPVPQGKAGVTAKEYLHQQIHGVGWATDYNFKLYNTLFKADQLNNAVARGYAFSINDRHLSPIIGGTYGAAGTTKHTDASGSGTSYQEKLYNTLKNARRDLGSRTDPDTKKKIDASGLVLLVSKSDAIDVEEVWKGQLNKFADSKNLASLQGIDTVLGYDGDSITVGKDVFVATGVTSGTGYLIKPMDRAFRSLFKRTLTKLVQAFMNPFTLTSDEKSWHYVNGLYNTFGIANHVQKITFPAIT